MGLQILPTWIKHNLQLMMEKLMKQPNLKMSGVYEVNQDLTSDFTSCNPPF